MHKTKRLYISAISIIMLFLGSLLMFAVGFGLLSKNAVFAGIVCFIVFAFIELIYRKKIGAKSDQQWKSHKNTEHK